MNGIRDHLEVLMKTTAISAVALLMLAGTFSAQKAEPRDLDLASHQQSTPTFHHRHCSVNDSRSCAKILNSSTSSTITIVDVDV
jgi:hypothetical protein